MDAHSERTVCDFNDEILTRKLTFRGIIVIKTSISLFSHRYNSDEKIRNS